MCVSLVYIMYNYITLHGAKKMKDAKTITIIFSPISF